MMRSFFIVDDHSFTAEGIKAAFSALPLECKGIAHSVDDAYKKVLETHPDCVFVDHSIHDRTGLDLIKLLKDKVSPSRFILVSQVESRSIIKLYVELGIKGVVSKLSGVNELQAAFSSMDQKTYLCPLFSKLMEGEDTETLLTPREFEISRYIAQGKTNKEIAQSLSCSEFTIKSHKVSIMRKLKCSTSVEIGVWVLRNHGV